MDKKEKRCPFCNAALEKVHAEANYGRVLLLDQCPRCGGVWFDRWELYFLRPAEAARLASVNIKTLHGPSPAGRKDGACPVCGEPLTAFNDPGLPRDAEIKRCVKCSGLWLNRGALGKYAAFRGAARKEPVRTASLSTLKNLQKALDLKNITEPAVALAATVTPGELARDVVPIILQILLRMII